MRGLLRALACALASVTVVGCTFLISFDDEPTTRPGSDASTRDSATSRDVAEVPDTPVCDETFPRDQVSCAAFIPNALACGTQFTNYPSSTPERDLVTCGAGDDVTCIRHCRNGCAAMPNAFPDQCDECAGKVGTYCGRDMANWESANADLLVTCDGDRTNNVTNCTAGCDARGGTGGAACL